MLKAFWHSTAHDKPSKGCLSRGSNNSTCALVQIIFFFSITLAWGEIRNVTQTKVFFIPKTQRCYLFGLLGTQNGWRNFAGDYNHPLINPRLIVCGERRRKKKTEGQIDGGEKQPRVKVLCSRRVRSCGDGFLGSSLQARAKLSWNKRGMTPLMKERELTRIALAQCSRSFCQLRLRRYNKVHEYNEAWVRLGLNCVESLPWDVFKLLSTSFGLPHAMFRWFNGVFALLEIIHVLGF